MSWYTFEAVAEHFGTQFVVCEHGTEVLGDCLMIVVNVLVADQGG